MSDIIFVDELKRLISSGDKEALYELCRQAHPGTVAEAMSELEIQKIWQILKGLDIALRAEVFSNFELDMQVELVTGQNKREMAFLLEEMPADDRADLVKKLDDKLREEILPLVARAEREDIRKLAAYEDGTAGAVMNTDYAVLKQDLTISKAIEILRFQAPRKETIYYIYIVDSERKLIGFVSLKDIITAKADSSIKDIMHTDVIKANVNDDQEDIAKLIEKYDLIAVPIVDDNDVMIGIVTHDDALDIIRQEQTEDMEKFMGIAGLHEVGDYLSTTAWEHFSKRAYWVVGLAAMGLVSGIIIHSHEAALMNMILLAMYMPMIADAGGNTGSQAATVIVRALALGQLKTGDFFKVIFKELRISLCLGAILAVLAFGRVLFLSRSANVPAGYSLHGIATAIAVALGVQVVSATLVGAILPLLAAKFKQDPAIVASPALTTIVDITGLLIYFTTAKLILGV
jgi:magnesium transporter